MSEEKVNVIDMLKFTLDKLLSKYSNKYSDTNPVKMFFFNKKYCDSSFWSNNFKDKESSVENITRNKKIVSFMPSQLWYKLNHETELFYEHYTQILADFLDDLIKDMNSINGTQFEIDKESWDCILVECFEHTYGEEEWGRLGLNPEDIKNKMIHKTQLKF